MQYLLESLLRQGIPITYRIIDLEQSGAEAATHKLCQLSKHCAPTRSGISPRPSITSRGSSASIPLSPRTLIRQAGGRRGLALCQRSLHGPQSARRVPRVAEAGAPRRLALAAQDSAGFPHALAQILEQVIVHGAPPSSPGYGFRATAVPGQPEARSPQDCTER